jgi:hypothetical protein
MQDSKRCRAVTVTAVAGFDEKVIPMIPFNVYFYCSYFLHPDCPRVQILRR